MKLVLIEWEDSHSGRGWQEMNQLKKASEPLYCRSVGWLAAEKNGCVVLVPHVSGEKNDEVAVHGCGDLTIPKRAITRTTVLRQA
jgi:hypothetical protein